MSKKNKKSSNLVKKIDKSSKKMYEDVPLTRRFLSYLIDWYLGGLATAFPIAMISQKLFGSMLKQNILEFPKPYGLIAGCLGFVFALFYFVVVPTWITKGQTLGKKICKIQIVKDNEEEITFKNMFLRQLVGIIVVEGSLVTASAIWHQIFTLLTGIDIVSGLMYVGLAICVVSAGMVIFTKDHKAIHDYIGSTRVVMCK